MKGKNIYSILACCAIAWAFSACTDTWDEHYKVDESMLGQTGDSYLWELIEKDSDLEEFAALLKATGYDTLLTKNRSYTILAPADGSGFIDVESLGQATQEQLDAYKKEIVENHIANYIHAASGIRDKADTRNYKMVEMLNTKKYDFEGGAANEYTFKGLTLKASNITAKNGMLHKVDGYVGFAANIWEQLAKEKSISMLWAFLKKDFKREFNPNASIKGPLDDGKETWLDSAFTESCRWFGEIGWLDREDSSYTMYAMTDNAWQEMYNTTSAYFDFSQWGDTTRTQPTKGSLTAEQARDSIVYNLMCRNLVFSNTINKKFYAGKCDSLISNAYPRKTFVNEEAHALSDGTIVGYPMTLSNGTLYVVDQVNYNPFTCWFDTVRVQGESLSDANENRLGFDQCAKSVSYIHRDSLLYDNVSGHAVAVYKAKNLTNGGEYNAKPEFRFYANDLLSAYYRVKIVLLPPQLLNSTDTTFVKPNKFSARLSDNDLINEVCVDMTDGDSIFVSDPTKIDTIVLCDCFKMPYSDYQKKDLIGEEPAVYLEIKTELSFALYDFGGGGTDNVGVKKDPLVWKYDNDYRIDQVIFEPIIPEGE